MSKPSPASINRQLSALRRTINNDKDPLVTRLAYLVETSLRWATEDTVGWPSRIADVQFTAELIRKELRDTGAA